MGGITGKVPEVPATAERTLSMDATASSADASDGSGLVSIEQGGKLVMKKSYYTKLPVPRDRELDRPSQPRVQEILNQNLYSELARLSDWIMWADPYMEELERKVAEAEILRAEDQKKAADAKADLRKEHEKKLKGAYSGFIETAIPEGKKKVQEALEKRKEDLKVAEAKALRLQADSKTYQDLCDVVQSMGDKLEKAVREMRTLTAGKNRPQQAFERWEKLFCEPNIRLVELNRQLKRDRDENRRQHVEQMEVVQGQEERASKLAIQKVVEVALLEEQRRDLSKEREEWRLRKGQELSESEQKDVMEAWLESKIEEIKPAIMKEATEHSWMLQKSQWKLQTAAAIKDAKEQGRKLGHSRGSEEGYRKGKVDGVEEGYKKGKMDANAYLQNRINKARSDGHGEGYNEGHLAGKSEGFSEGYTEGFAKGKDEAYEEGHDAGYSQGYESGHADGKIDGDQESFDEGHKKGHSEGYQAGKDEWYTHGWNNAFADAELRYRF